MQCAAMEAVLPDDLAEAAHYSTYAFAAYGYMLYIWSKPQYKCGPCLLECAHAAPFALGCRGMYLPHLRVCMQLHALPLVQAQFKCASASVSAHYSIHAFAACGYMPCTPAKPRCKCAPLLASVRMLRPPLR